MAKKVQADGSVFPSVLYVDSDRDDGVFFASTAPFEGEVGEYRFVRVRNFKIKFVEED